MVAYGTIIRASSATLYDACKVVLVRFHRCNHEKKISLFIVGTTGDGKFPKKFKSGKKTRKNSEKKEKTAGKRINSVRRPGLGRI